MENLRHNLQMMKTNFCHDWKIVKIGEEIKVGTKFESIAKIQQQLKIGTYHLEQISFLNVVATKFQNNS